MRVVVVAAMGARARERPQDLVVEGNRDELLTVVVRLHRVPASRVLAQSPRSQIYLGSTV